MRQTGRQGRQAGRASSLCQRSSKPSNRNILQQPCQLIPLRQTRTSAFLPLHQLPARALLLLSFTPRLSFVLCAAVRSWALSWTIPRSVLREAVFVISVVHFLLKTPRSAMALSLSSVRRATLIAVVVATMGSAVMAQAPAPEPAVSAAPSVVPSVVVASFVSLLGFVASTVM